MQLSTGVEEKVWFVVEAMIWRLCEPSAYIIRVPNNRLGTASGTHELLMVSDPPASPLRALPQPGRLPGVQMAFGGGFFYISGPGPVPRGRELPGASRSGDRSWGGWTKSRTRITRRMSTGGGGREDHDDEEDELPPDVRGEGLEGGAGDDGDGPEGPTRDNRMDREWR